MLYLPDISFELSYGELILDYLINPSYLRSRISDLKDKELLDFFVKFAK